MKDEPGMGLTENTNIYTKLAPLIVNLGGIKATKSYEKIIS